MDIKKHFGDTLTDMLKRLSFEEITVQMILDESTLSRSTFYRHFKDKYDLANWCYLSNIEVFLNHGRYDTWEGYLRDVFSFIYNNRVFFKQTFDFREANTFWSFLYKFSYDHCERTYLKMWNLKNLPDEDRVGIEFYVMGSIHIASQWVKRGAPESADDMAKWAYDLTPKKYRDSFDGLLNLTSRKI